MTTRCWTTPLLAAVAACGGGALASEMPAVHSRAPSFAAPDQSGEVVRLEELAGRPIVLYFYPRDGTPGCTAEACAFRDAWDRLAATGAHVVGVSDDSVESHRAFADEHGLRFPLLADPERRIIDAYGVRSPMGFALRVTFIIDGEGIVRRVFRDVDPAVHVDEVVAALEELARVQPHR
jgi:peroxiredoxin Q/BCP